MADLVDIVQNAVTEATAGGDSEGSDLDTGSESESDSDASADAGVDSGDESTDGSTDTGRDEEAVSPSAIASKEKPVEKKVEKPVELDEVDKLLEADGIKASKDSQGRENRIPHSRTKKIIENALKKERVGHTTQLAEKDTQLTGFKTKAETMDRIDKLIDSDPDRYISILATMHPDKFGKYVGATSKETKVVTAQPDANDPEPQADLKYTDGSTGYSNEQWAKLRQWDRREAAREVETRVRADYDKRLKPIEDERLAVAVHNEQVPKINAQLDWAKKTYGKDFEDDYALAESGKSEVLNLMRANPQLSFEACLAQVFTPKLAERSRVNEAKVRERFVTEMNERPAGSVRTPSGGNKTGVEATGPRTTEDVIRDSIRAAGLK